jgi:hypothetical protein
MYRQIFTPVQNNLVIPITIPEEWLGLNVEVIAFPLDIPHSDNTDLIKKRRQKRVDMLKNYKFKKGEYIFDREEANNYE